ncbi:MAG: 1-deoxy-D-xylulose-5-phosphate synthase [Planctomycetota bacterium]|nr:1-deoxy-D-xylulose-5-phosphate synthase [Planctomycetota bacterium]
MMSLLETIDSPQDLRKLEVSQLPKLAAEIRSFIIDVVLKNSGHLSPNLGVVELTLALHYVFDFKSDVLIFDVSHQCYTHKILTGRRKEFNTLRLKGGISGFTNPQESEYDSFVTGHAGTALSTALGIALAERMSGGTKKVVALVGDGALGVGMSLEALNHAGFLKPNLLVVLNDNKMSISPTVGAFAKYLSKIRIGTLYRDVRRRIRRFARTLPKILRSAEETAERALSSLRGLVLPPGALFSDLGFSYYGPVDGHNITLLVSLLTRLKSELEGPTILHVVTQKGRGYSPAENDPERFHGITPLILSPDGKVRTQSLEKETTYTDSFSEALLQVAENEKRIVAITAGMPEGTGLLPFRERFPDRFYDVGICESHALGIAAGLAKEGFFPVIALYSTFLQRAFDQLFHEIALQKTPCLIAIDRAGIVGRDGMTHHGMFDIAYTRLFPHLVVAAVKDGSEFKPFILTALEKKLSLLLRYPRAKCPQSETEIKTSFEKRLFDVGKGEILNKGEKVAILAYGSMVKEALDAARILKKRKDFSPTVVNLRFAKPLDGELIMKMAESHSILLTVEEGCLAGGIGTAVAETLLGTPYINRLHIHAVKDRFIGHGSRSELLSELKLDAEGITSICESLLNFS